MWGAVKRYPEIDSLNFYIRKERINHYEVRFQLQKFNNKSSMLNTKKNSSLEIRITDQIKI